MNPTVMVTNRNHQERKSRPEVSLPRAANAVMKKQSMVAKIAATIQPAFRVKYFPSISLTSSF
jgi:hypothetical protein